MPKFVPDLVAWGAGPRASQYLILGGKARAILHGRLHVTTEDIREVAYPVLRHRLVTTFNADAEGITTDELIRRLISAVPLPQEEGGAGSGVSSPGAWRSHGSRLSFGNPASAPSCPTAAVMPSRRHHAQKPRPSSASGPSPSATSPTNGPASSGSRSATGSATSARTARPSATGRR